MASTLRLAKNLALPLDAVTETFAFLAKRGAGKSYTASVLAEAMLDLGVHVVILDPMGIWYGLRTLADGKSPGYQIPILGGDHGDIPLESTGGRLVADLVMRDKISAVIDVSLFTKGERKRFVADFAERLYRKNRDPLHLILEESDMFAPQKPQQGEQRMLGAIEDIVRRGRSRGLGISLICQRSAVLNKDVLTQTECLVALRTTAPHDKKAIKDWIDAHADRDEQKTVLDSLSGLPTGTAWFWSPAWLGKLQRVKINKKRTLDTGATPKFGARLKTMKTVAEVDLSQLAQQMSTAIENAKAEDPKRLQSRIRELEKERDHALRAAKVDIAPIVAQTVTDIQAQWDQVFSDQNKIINALRDRAESVATELGQIGQEILGLGTDLGNVKGGDLPNAPTVVNSIDTGDIVAAIGSADGDKVFLNSVSRKRKSIAQQVNSVSTPPAILSKELSSLPKGAQRLVETLVANHPNYLTKQQLGFLSTISWRGGTFTTYLSKLRIRGLINESNNEIQASDLAVKLSGGPRRKMTREELVDWYRRKLPSGAQRMLDVLNRLDGTTIDKIELGEKAGISTAGGTFTTYLSKLRINGLIDESDGGIALSSMLLNA